MYTFYRLDVSGEQHSLVYKDDDDFKELEEIIECVDGNFLTYANFCKVQ